MRWILEENSEAVLQAVDLNFGRLDGRQRRVNCLMHCRKQNQTLNWFSQCTKFERYGTVFDMNANHELTAQIAKMFAVLNLCHVSSDVPKQNEQNSEVSTFFRSSTSPTRSHLCHPARCCTSRFPATNLLTGEDMNAWLKEIS